jgi:hypothetical protein
MKADDFGRGWREHVDFYYPCARMIGYDELVVESKLLRLLPRDIQERIGFKAITEAIVKSNFAELQKAEQQGFGIYPSGDLSIPFFRKGVSGQWRELSPELKEQMLERNYIQLKVLYYL